MGTVRSKLTDALQGRIVAALEEGASRRQAAKYGPVNRCTIADWIERADDPERDPDGRFARFRDAVEGAEAEYESKLLATIEAAGKRPTSWQASAWILERRWPERWGRIDRSKIELTGGNGGPVELGIDLPKVAGDAALAFVKQLGDAADGVKP